jgi:hypothetical protein
MTLEATKTQAYLDDRAHVFHSWSAQGTLNPVEIAGGLTNIQNLSQQFKNKPASCARSLHHSQTMLALKQHV